jgi:hypothetical protein
MLNINMNYPYHKHSKFIDPQFSFSNKVYPSKVDMVDRLKNMRCDGNIMLEPRLQEYLKKKKFYKENNISSCIKPEDEFQISHKDKMMLREFFKGKKNLYDYDNKKFNEGQKNRRTKKKCFPSKAFRDGDPRVPQLKNKNINDEPINRGMFYPEKDGTYYATDTKPLDPIMDARDFTTQLSPYSTNNSMSTVPDHHVSDIGANNRSYMNLEPLDNGWDMDDTGFDPRVDPRMNPGVEKYNKHKSQFRINPQHNKSFADQDPDPRNKFIVSDLSHSPDPYSGGLNTEWGNYNNTTNKHKNHKIIDNNNILSKGTSYGEMATPTFSGQSELDFDNKKFIPQTTSNSKKYINSSCYTTMPFISQTNSGMNTELESSLIRGTPHNTTKSYGYRNPSEHYYDFIEDDFQNPDNTVEPWGPRGGESTRRNNKALAKQTKYRDFNEMTC